MAIHNLDRNFRRFFSNINPSSTYEATASSEQNNVARLLESADGPGAVIGPKCFLQGSYKQDTAIHTINDLDVVALCALEQPGGEGQERRYSRDEIFKLLAGSLTRDHRYRNKIRYGAQSLCIKIDLDIRVEILPAVKKAGVTSFDYEPFRIYRPELGQWVDAYARYHQELLTDKNKRAGNFKPLIKVFKHLRDLSEDVNREDAVSFHIECLLYCVPDSVFSGSIPDVIENVLSSIAGFTPTQAQSSGITSPRGDKLIFSEDEWSDAAYSAFHGYVSEWWALAHKANCKQDWDDAVDTWKELLGYTYFPRDVS